MARAMVPRESLVLVAVGVGIGLPVAFATTRLVASQLYGVKPNDLPTIAVTIVVLATVGAAAAYVHACRASRAAPTVALKYE